MRPRCASAIVLPNNGATYRGLPKGAKEEVALMRRVILLVTVGLVMAAVMAVPAWADEPDHPGDCRFERGKTYCTEKERIGSGIEQTDVEYDTVFCAPTSPEELPSFYLVVTSTFRPYTDYWVTETTYAGKSEHVLDQDTRTEREYGPEFTIRSETGQCPG